MVVDEQSYQRIVNAVGDGRPEEVGKHMGSWATKDQIQTEADVRENLAISSEWKGRSGMPMYVVEFTVKPGVGVREGTVGPMFDSKMGSVLPGGGHQVQFMVNAPHTSPENFVVNLSRSGRIQP